MSRFAKTGTTYFRHLWQPKLPKIYKHRRLAWVRPTNKKTHILSSSVSRTTLFTKQTLPFSKIGGYSHVVLTFSLVGKVRTMPNRVRRFLIARVKRLKHTDVVLKRCWVTVGVLFFLFNKGQNMRMGKGDGSFYSSYRYVLPSKPLFIVGSNSLNLQTHFRNYLAVRFGSPVKYTYKPSFNFYKGNHNIIISRRQKRSRVRHRFSQRRSLIRGRKALSLFRNLSKLYKYRWGSLFRKVWFRKRLRKQIFRYNFILDFNSRVPQTILTSWEYNTTAIRKFYTNHLYFKRKSFY